MIDFQLAGMALAKIILACCSFGSGIFVGVKVANKANKWWGWVAGLTTFVIVGVLLASATLAIDGRICELDELSEECD